MIPYDGGFTFKSPKFLYLILADATEPINDMNKRKAGFKENKFSPDGMDIFSETRLKMNAKIINNVVKGEIKNKIQPKEETTEK